MTYNFDQDLSTEKFDIKIDTAENYGYFERHTNGAGGGLWFYRNDDNGEIELMDYDGVYQLPQEVVKALRAAGYHLDETHDPDKEP